MCLASDSEAAKTCLRKWAKDGVPWGLVTVSSALGLEVGGRNSSWTWKEQPVPTQPHHRSPSAACMGAEKGKGRTSRAKGRCLAQDTAWEHTLPSSAGGGHGWWEPLSFHFLGLLSPSPPFQPFQTLALPPRVSFPSQLSVESNQTQTHFIFLDKVNAVLVEGEGLESQKQPLFRVPQLLP